MQNEISKLSHEDRWNYFFRKLKVQGIPQETSPADYPKDILATFQAIMDQDYRDANNGEDPQNRNISETALFKLVKTQSERGNINHDSII